jgi:hypothetical protein
MEELEVWRAERDQGRESRVIVLDTHVVSAPLKTMPAPRVMEWLDNQSAETLFITFP